MQTVAVEPEELLSRLEKVLLTSQSEWDGSHWDGQYVATAAGVDRSLTTRLWRAMGLPEADEGEESYVEMDLEALEKVLRVQNDEGMDTHELLFLTRSIGLASSRIAEAVAGLMENRFLAAALEAKTEEDIQTLFDGVAASLAYHDWLIRYLVHRHLLDATTSRLSQSDPGVLGNSVVVVGFADLVGFTAISQMLSDTDIAALMERFEALAIDAVVRGNGRVIKMIGDEIMFIAPPTEVGDIAISLTECFASPDLPAVRVGLASGSVVSRGGDIFGPVVNLASRVTAMARPGTALISPGLAELLSDDERFKLRRIPSRKLKGIGSVELSVLRRATDEERSEH